MSFKDTRDESLEGDAMCIACRTAAEMEREEEAVASFCQNLRGPVADWFSNIITGSRFTFVKTTDVGDLCYINGRMLLVCVAEGFTVRLIRINNLSPSQPDWGITFDLATPDRIVLATIKAAMAETSK